MATPPKTPQDPSKYGRRATDHITASLAGSLTETAGAPLLAGATGVRTDVVTATTRLGTLSRIGTDRLVTVEGVTGVFTPITTATDTPLGTDERKNLLAILDELKREIGALQTSNLKLTNDLRALRERPSAPDDFATAVQQSLDEMQQRMSTMRNSMSNFAVRELKLEASVFVQVSPLGSIEYRFVQPGDDVEAAAVSRLSLDIVPVPKNDLAGVWTVNLFQPHVPISALSGITAEQTKSLESAGLFSIGEFLQVGTRARAQAYLEALLGTERSRLELWAQQAMLMTLRGVNGAAAMVLIAAGIGSFEALAGLTVEVVVKAYGETRNKRTDLGAPPADAGSATLWIRAARQYLGLSEPEVVAVS